MAHYFENDESVISEPATITYDFQGKHLIYTTDHGVFSRQRLDFGSRVLMDSIDIGNAKSMLDVGCGYGTMGIALKSVHEDLQVLMTDVNKRAISLAKENIKCNNLEGIDVIESDVYENVHDTYDLVISNPPIRAGKKVVSAIISGSYDHLNKGGRLVIVIQKKQGAPSAKKLMEDIFGNATVINREKGYYILQSYK
ncbi:class I SAM-dependent methyltransferase [Sharpea azabuensis]|uniref:16S rRNA (Guanine1207-N2)-methyltransferase n=1 Tax=Sharpea azabuensis TaxID=322505 RepID=A0A1H6U3X4_9FIRM|nr:class I SAM-dependent methyltransferase [Sharpea azabuensis]HAJ15363.1 class I SAM-dependent methyltransferase [Erysipelotrichaceae bacterium]MEE3307723.1 class I SAM-dependent methyltransferase [Sharpea azabuensis]SEI87058.1 16S rRNA (guanine1207-N2)-methyltransferase [Sharpea azabuensis]SFD67794.1 16S rRNA (guanine1207-N2)-methyltransferase [Sharpea azabuensis]SFK63589.1 16S rRNA (guanine1207-N2)-methyltransferase [Sharpea azabuensis]